MVMKNKFAENIENDVLYEVTGASKYFVRNFTSDISDCNLYTDIYMRKRTIRFRSRKRHRT